MYKALGQLGQDESASYRADVAWNTSSELSDIMDYAGRIRQLWGGKEGGVFDDVRRPERPCLARRAPRLRESLSAAKTTFDHPLVLITYPYIAHCMGGV